MELVLPPSPASPDEIVDALVDQLPRGAQLVMPIGNGEPVRLLDALEARAEELHDVTIHQMHALHDRPYLHGAYRGHLNHVSWFLSHVTRKAYQAGGCEFAPANFSEVPLRLMEKNPVAVLAAASPADRNGHYSLGTGADYAAPMIGRVPFILEVNQQMPRTFGENRVRHQNALAWCEADYPLVEAAAPEASDIDRTIAALVADRIGDGSTLQLGIGSVPSQVAKLLVDRKDLAIHTELFSDPLVDLIESGAATGRYKVRSKGRALTTFALGTKRLYDFLDNNDDVIFVGVDEVNDPRLVGREPRFASVNATLQVDLFGQCASESIGTHYFSGSGGQADFARGAQYSEGGQGFIVLPSTTSGGRISRITPTLNSGAVVTTNKNTVDNVVTEFGIAELRGKTMSQRAQSLISIAHPDHRSWLAREAEACGMIR